jgi:hypothetical protein
MTRLFSFIPLSIGLMVFPSLVWNMAPANGDGPNTDYFGFPLPWNSRSIAASLVKDVYIVPLALDLAFYLLVGFFLWRAVSGYIDRLGNLARWGILSFVWGYGLIAGAWICLVLSIETFLNVWYTYKLDIWSIKIGLVV